MAMFSSEAHVARMKVAVSPRHGLGLFPATAFVVALISGCAGFQARTGRAGPRVPVLAGIWEGFSQDKIADGLGAGDTRVERQAWDLRQTGSSIHGFYVAELTMLSGDGRPYLCSREPRFSTLLRFEVRGRVSASGIEIEEVGDALTKGPCRPVFRSPTRFRVELRGDTLTLLDGAQRQTLYRRTGKDPQGLTQQLLAFERPDQILDR